MGKRLYGIKRAKLPGSSKGGKTCTNCNRGLLFTTYDYQNNCEITRCQFCNITRIDRDKKLCAKFRTAQDLR